MSRDVYGIFAERVHIGLSAAIGLTQIPGQISTSFKYLSGGTLEIVGSTAINAPPGWSLPVATWGAGYIVGTAEVIACDGPASFYLRSTGATSTIMVLRGLSNGYGQP